jgi:hypothetical protein
MIKFGTIMKFQFDHPYMVIGRDRRRRVWWLLFINDVRGRILETSDEIMALGTIVEA